MEKQHPQPTHQQQAAEGPESAANAKLPGLAAPPFQLFAGDGGGGHAGGSGAPLPDDLRAGIEQLSGMDMGDVRVHNMSPLPAAFQALAFAQGTHIHIGPGQGHLLAHEAWHVAQQKQGRVRATSSLNGMGVNEDASLEQEADIMGARAMQAQAAEATALKQGQAAGEVIQFGKQTNYRRKVSNSGKSPIRHKSASKDSMKIQKHHDPEIDFSNHEEVLAYAMQGVDIYLKDIQTIAENSNVWDDEYQKAFNKIRAHAEQLVRVTSSFPDIKKVFLPSNRMITRRGATQYLCKRIKLSPSKLRAVGSNLVGQLRDGPKGAKTLFRIMDYCNGKDTNEPGAGNLLSLGIKGDHIKGRPGFDKKTQEKLSLAPQKARRHIVPWHTLRKVIDTLYQQHGQKLINFLDEALIMYAPKEILDKVATKTQKKTDKSFGEIGKEHGSTLLQALYVMNSNVNNLWIGNGGINSTINSVMGPMKSALEKCKSRNDLEELLDTWKMPNSKLSDIGKSAKQLACEILDSELHDDRDGTGNLKPKMLNVEEIKLRIKSHCLDSLEIDGLSSKEDGSIKGKLYDTPKMNNLKNAGVWLEVADGIRNALDDTTMDAIKYMLKYPDDMYEQDQLDKMDEIGKQDNKLDDEIEMKDNIDEKDDEIEMKDNIDEKDDEIEMKDNIDEKDEMNDDNQIDISSDDDSMNNISISPNNYHLNQTFDTIDTNDIFDENTFNINWKDYIHQTLETENDYWGPDFDQFDNTQEETNDINSNEQTSFSSNYLNQYDQNEWDFNNYFGFNQSNGFNPFDNNFKF